MWGRQSAAGELARAPRRVKRIETWHAAARACDLCKPATRIRLWCDAKERRKTITWINTVYSGDFSGRRSVLHRYVVSSFLFFVVVGLQLFNFAIAIYEFIHFCPLSTWSWSLLRGTGTRALGSRERLNGLRTGAKRSIRLTVSDDCKNRVVLGVFTRETVRQHCLGPGR